MKAFMTEFFDKKKLTHIVCMSEKGEHIFDAIWDEEDENTPENRVKFRDWVVKLLARKGYTIE